MQNLFRACLELAGGSHLATKGRELRLVGQRSVPEEICGFLECGDGGEVFDEVAAAIDEPAVGAVDLADGGLGGDNTFQPWAELRHEA